MSWEFEAPPLQIPPLIYTTSAADLMAGGEPEDSSDSFLTLEGPTVVECLNAEHDAQKAIAEIDRLPAVPQSSASPRLTLK